MSFVVKAYPAEAIHFHYEKIPEAITLKSDIFFSEEEAESPETGLIIGIRIRWTVRLISNNVCYLSYISEQYFEFLDTVANLTLEHLTTIVAASIEAATEGFYILAKKHNIKTGLTIMPLKEHELIMVLNSLRS